METFHLVEDCRVDNIQQMFEWIRKRKPKQLTKQPFPIEWCSILEHRFPHYAYLNSDEKQRLGTLIQLFIAQKRFEGRREMEITDEVRVLVAANACLLILELSFDFFRDVSAVLVYPSAMTRPEALFGDRHTHGEVTRKETPLSGEAHENGPVMLAWDSITGNAIQADDGLNVIFHEFAHKLDMLTGEADGVPPLHQASDYTAWAEVCGREYRHLVRRFSKGLDSFFDDSASEHPAEFFAVATEVFFEKPKEMKRRRPKLYEVLKGFYRQDPVLRGYESEKEPG
jgi:Mlc titration factor MtfA (ptsG expression regulator)